MMNYETFMAEANNGRLLYDGHLVASVELDMAYCACCGHDCVHSAFFDETLVRPVDSGVLGLVFTRHALTPDQRRAMVVDFGGDDGEIGPVVLPGAQRDLSVDPPEQILDDIRAHAERCGSKRVLVYGVIPAPLREALHLAHTDARNDHVPHLITVEIYEAVNSARSDEDGPRTFSFVRWAWTGEYAISSNDSRRCAAS